jgi:hypothetical protein
MAKSQSDRYSKKEAHERMERALRKLLSTPPKPRKSMIPKRPERKKANRRGAVLEAPFFVAPAGG